MMPLAGADLNATRVRAVSGPASATLRPLALEGEQGAALPLAIRLAGRRPEVGSAALRICRRLPHLTCGAFLPHLGSDRRWTTDRHQLDASQALTLVLKQLQAALAECAGLAVALPIYLTAEQTALFTRLATQVKLPLLGWVAAPLALAMQARTQRPWFGPALVLDVDEHALCWAVVQVDEPPAALTAQIVAEQVAPALGLRAWKERLLTGIADRCVRHSRRDPRASGESEQMLYDQLDGALETCRQGELIPLAVQSDQWYQEFVLQPAELQQYSSVLVRQTLSDVRELLAVARSDQPPVLLVATAAAARLPGLLAALENQFGPRTRVAVLADDAVAEGAHALAVRWHQGSLADRSLREVLPWPDGSRSNGAAKPDKGARGSRMPSWGGRRLHTGDE